MHSSKMICIRIIIRFSIVFLSLHSISRAADPTSGTIEYQVEANCMVAQMDDQLPGFINLAGTYNAGKNRVEVDMTSLQSLPGVNAAVLSGCYSNIANQNFDQQITNLCHRLNEELREGCINESYTHIDRQITAQREALISQTSHSLFPSGVYPGEEQVHGNFPRLNRSLQEYCGNRNFSNEHLTLTYMRDHLRTLLEAVDNTCQRRILNSYQNRLTDLYAEALNVTDEPERVRTLNGINTAIDLLFQEYTHFSSELNYEEFATFRCAYNDHQNLEHLLQAFGQIQDEFTCMEYEMGPDNGRDHLYTEENSPSGVPASYRIERVSQNTFRAQVPVYFYSRENDPGLTTNYFPEAEDCLNEFGDRLRDSAGRRLEIDLIQGDIGDMSSNPIEIVFDTNHRSNSNQWNSEISCETMIHEIMHLMGLCDEYQEFENGYVVDANNNFVAEQVGFFGENHAMNCRALGPSNSIMNNQTNALGPGLVRFTVTCERCEGLSGELNAVDYEQHVLRIRSAYQQDPSVYGTEPQFEIVSRVHNVGPALHRTHLDAILYPGCQRRNQIYYQCAQAAYVTAIDDERWQDGPRQCPELPEECRDGNPGWIQW